MLFDKKWCQIWLCPLKKCLIWFRLHCLSEIRAISWEKRILNFIKIVQYFSISESVVISKFVPFFFFFFFVLFIFFGSTIKIDSFEFKKSLLIDFGIHRNALIKILKDCKWLFSQNQWVRNIKFKGRQCPD